MVYYITQPLSEELEEKTKEKRARGGPFIARVLPVALQQRLTILTCVVHAEISANVAWIGEDSSFEQSWFSELDGEERVGKGGQGATASSSSTSFAMNSSFVYTTCSAAVELLAQHNHGTDFSQEHREALGVAYLVRTRATLAHHEEAVLNLDSSSTNNHSSTHFRNTAEHPASYMEFRFGHTAKDESTTDARTSFDQAPHSMPRHLP